MWSQYMFNSFIPKKDNELLEESIMRKNLLNDSKDQTKEKSDTIQITASDFMTEGAGRFVNGADSKMVKNFMTINV